MEHILSSQRNIYKGQQAIGATIFSGFFFLFFLRLALIHPSLWPLAFALLCFFLLFSSWGYVFIERYLFFSDRVVIQDHRGKFALELFWDQVCAWDEIKEQRKNSTYIFLLIHFPTNTIRIAESDYRNYRQILKFIESKQLPRNSNLNEEELPAVVNNPIYQDFFTLMTLSTALVAIVYIIILSQKDRSGESLIIQGKIDKVDYVFHHKSGYNHTAIQLEHYPDVVFKAMHPMDRDTFQLYVLEKATPELRDSIWLKVSKSDYEWRVENFWIKKVRLGEPGEVEILEYRLY